MAKAKKVVKAKQAENVKKAPVGVQIISVLYYISAVLCALLGLLLILGANAIISLLASSTPELGNLGAGLFIVAGIIFIGLGVLGFFIGKDLWKLKPWARIIAIIIAILGVILTVYSMVKGFAFMQIIKLIIHAVIGIYLMFSEEVKKAFK